MKCFSFNRNDFALLLALYDTTYILVKSFTSFSNNLCLLVSLLVLLIAMFFMITSDIKHKKVSDALKNKDLEVKIKNQIGEEYKTLQRKKELLSRLDLLSPFDKMDLTKTPYKVHMSYLNRIDTSGFPEDEETGHR